MIAAALRDLVRLSQFSGGTQTRRSRDMNLKRRLAGDVPLCGTFVFSSDPANTDIAARAGFDFVIVDREHR
jgi:2-keto-3-deoxy-L-rhamnonate aldolase RhmA